MGSIADIAAALAAIPDQELHALRAALDEEIVIVPELLAWLEAATGWEINRRAGSCHDLPDPRAAIMDRVAVECSLVALAILHAQLRNVAGAARFFDVTADALCVIDAVGSSAGVH